MEDALIRKAPAFVFEDLLTAVDGKRYIHFPFDVPPGTSRLRIDLYYEAGSTPWPPSVRNLISLTLFDPHSFRGSKHSSERHKVVEIGPQAATPGFWPEALVPGRWLIELDTFLVMPGQPMGCRIEVRLEEGDTPGELVNNPWCTPQSPGHTPGWYRGDLHTHTVHSDGSQTVAELLNAARRHGLDFVALTDHNTISHLLDAAVAGCRDLVLIPGMELTTYWGHGVALGVTDWIDWRTRHERRTMGDCIAEIHDRGGLVVMAHPAGMGDPVCTGCAWLYTDQMPGAVDAVEVWNGPWFELGTNSPDSLLLWYDWLNQGHRLTATAGTDGHNSRLYENAVAANVVYAHELSPAGVLEALAHGRSYLSSGPELDLEATLRDGSVAMMGSAVPAAEVAAVHLRWRGAPAEATAFWIVNGEEAARWMGAQGEEMAPLPPETRWGVLELRDREGTMLALTNPLYLRGA